MKHLDEMTLLRADLAEAMLRIRALESAKTERATEDPIDGPDPNNDTKTLAPPCPRFRSPHKSQFKGLPEGRRGSCDLCRADERHRISKAVARKGGDESVEPNPCRIGCGSPDSE